MSIRMEGETRPWGGFKVLYEDLKFKVKILNVLPGKRLSYQKHTRREERWTVVQGVATVVIEDEESRLDVGDVISIGMGQRHRLANNGKVLLKVVEVQMGDYFGEDDIERYDDDFGRV